MSYDNRVFSVNGKGSTMLLKTLQLAFLQDGDKTTAKAWKFSKTHGLILLWNNPENVEGANAFPAGLTAEQCLPFIEAWLDGDEAKSVKLNGWDRAADHDGDNGPGWRVYVEDWGQVDHLFSSICAITPAVLWYGK